MLAYGPASGVEKPVPANYVELSRRVAGYSALIQRHIHCAPEAHVSTWDMGAAEGLGSDSAAGGVYGACRADTGLLADLCSLQLAAQQITLQAQQIAFLVHDCQRLCFRGNTRLERVTGA